MDERGLRRLAERGKEEDGARAAELAGLAVKERARRSVTTVLIGCLCRFEEAFGSAWGMGKRPEELTDDEREWSLIWEGCRKLVLDNGNDRLRELLAELDRYEVKRRKDVLVLSVRK